MAIVSAIIGGFLGTIVMTMMIVNGHKMGLMPPKWKIIVDGLGGKINSMTGMPNSMAWAVHFLIGTVIHPLLVSSFSFGLGAYVNEIVYAMIFAVIMIMMLGFLGAPAEWKGKMSMGIIMAHLVYALILAFFIDQAILS